MEKFKIQLCTGGPKVSRLVAGAWRWEELSIAETAELIQASVERGITTFDHADIYGNYTCEENFGKAMGAKSSLRSKLQLVSKCGIKLVSKNRPKHSIHSYDTSRKHIMESAERSLKNLKTDYLDILLIHRPDPLMNADEIATAFDSLRTEGKVRYFGVSNFTNDQFELLNSRIHLVTNQIEVSALKLEPFTDGSLDLAQKHRFAPMAWSPFGGGRIFAPADEASKRLQKLLKELAEKYNCGADVLALAFLLKHPARIVPVLGTSKLKRMESAMAAFNLDLSREDWFRMYTTSLGEDIP